MLKWLASRFETRRAALQGRLEKSIESGFASKKAHQPEDWRRRGNELLKAGKLDEAQECYRQGTLANPNDAIAFSNLGYVLGELGRTDESRFMLLKALTLNPEDYDAHYMLGNLARAQGDFVQAVARYRSALAISPEFEICRRDLCVTLAQIGQTREARTVLSAGPAFATDSVDYYFFNGNLHLAENELDDAVANFLRAVELKPRDSSLLINLGVAQLRQRNVYAAMQTYKRIFEFEPDNVQAHANIAAAFQMAGKLDLAIQSYRRALQLDPEYLNAHQNLIFALTSDPHCLPTAYLAAARDYGARITARAKPYTQWLCPQTNGQTRPLRVGFVSGDLHHHPVGLFLENVVAHIDPNKLTLVAYSTGNTEDALTARIKPSFVEWNAVASLSDEMLAKKIYNDQIDILVDLAGHTALNRLPVFAWRAAPLQVSWLGYWASTGVAEIDYILVDPTSVPKSAQRFFSETCWYLPDTRLCFTPPVTEHEIEVQTLPALHKGFVTFGSFQSLNKIGDGSLSAWSRILSSLPSARLRLQNWQLGYADAKEDIHRRLAAADIDPARVDLFGGTTRDAYLAAYSEVDIILDTFPFPGGTTTVEALWMGVPTITLTGETLLARQGGSLLHCLGLDDWVATTEDEYLDMALAHARELAPLGELRTRLRSSVLSSPLFDAVRFSRHIEEAFTGMVRAKKAIEPATQ